MTKPNLKWVRNNPSNFPFDPYTMWFLVTEKTVFDFGIFREDKDVDNNLRFLVLTSRETPMLGIDAKKIITWEAPNSGSGFRYHAIGIEDGSNSTGLLPFPILNFLNDIDFQVSQNAIGSKAHGNSVNLSSETGNDVVQTLLHLAPLDDVMIPEPVDVDTQFKHSYCKPDQINPEKAVIFGILDDGINLVHERFREPNRDGDSRIDFAWVQDGQAVPGTSSPVMFGKELTKYDIKEAITQTSNEDEALRRLGLIRHNTPYSSSLTKRFSHGTFVLDKAAGYSSDTRLYKNGDPPKENNGTHPADRRIVSVQLPRRVSNETSGALYTLFALSGLRYIVDRAKMMAANIRNENGKKIPLVINFSYGLSGGPHNGEHLIERMIDQITDELDNDNDLGPLVMPMPTGNRFLLQGHASRKAHIRSKIKLNMDWVTQPDDATSNYMEIWVPENTLGDYVELRIEAPKGSKITTTKITLPIKNLGNDPIGDAYQLTHDTGKDTYARISVDRLDSSQFIRLAPSGKIRILIALAPTKTAGPDGNALPPGIWKISAKCLLAKDQWIEAWIQRDDTPPGFNKQGRTSYFARRGMTNGYTQIKEKEDELAEYNPLLEENSGISRYGTISGIATSPNMIAVGGSRTLEDDMPSLYSGASHSGITRLFEETTDADTGKLDTPDLVAPADRTRVHRGVLGSSSRSGGSFPVNGTSASAPIVARLVGDYLAHESGFSDAKTARKKAIEYLSKASTKVDLDTDGARALDSDSLRKWRGRSKVVRSGCLPKDGFDRI